MKRFLLALTVLASQITAEQSRTPFKVVLKSMTGADITLSLVAQTNSLILSESLFQCTPENKCTLQSGQVYKDYLDTKTPYTYRLIQVSFQDANGMEVKFFGKYATLSNNYLGVTNMLKWLDDVQSIFKIDPLTGRFEQVNEVPKDVIGPLPSDIVAVDYHLPANMHMEAPVSLTRNEGKADMLLKLLFPKFSDKNDGQYYLTYSSREIEYWDNCLGPVNQSNDSMSMKLWLDIASKMRVDLGPYIFRSYDGEAFKVNPDTEEPGEVRFGAFFAQHLDMKLYVQGSAKKDDHKVYMALKEGKLKKSVATYYFTLINLLSWALCLAAVGLLLAPALPGKYRRWLKPSGDNVVMI